MYTLYKFHFLNVISEINQLFDDILIIWPAPVYIYPLSPHPKGALLDWDLVTVEAIWVKWTHCHVQETSLR